MKIVLVITNSKRKSLVFVSDELKTYSLEETIQIIQDRKIEDAHVVTRNHTSYIRTHSSVTKNNEIDMLSITIGNLLLYAQGIHVTNVSPSLSFFIKLYRDSLAKNRQMIKPVEQPEVITESVKDKLNIYRAIIFAAANKFIIDPYLLGAILVDEIARLIPFESIADKILASAIGVNTSIGIAQVKTDTANALIQQGLYNPNPQDSKLPFKKLDGTARSHLYTYLIDPKHSIFFAAANIRFIINFWALKIDLNEKPEIITTLYHLGKGIPKTKPESNARGMQIMNDFYPLAKQWLK